MSSFVFFNMIIMMIAFVLITFAIFMIGFLFGYKIEDKKITRKKESCNKLIEESEQERKVKKEWKKFLEYDGSTPNGAE